MNKLAMIVLALVVSFVTNVKAVDQKTAIGTYSEPTGGKSEIRVSKTAKLYFALLNGTTPGEWQIEFTEANGEVDGFVFLEGIFKGQKYLMKDGANGKAEFHEQKGRKTVWTHE
jgi:hypothetical protein